MTNNLLRKKNALFLFLLGYRSCIFIASVLFVRASIISQHTSLLYPTNHFFWFIFYGVLGTILRIIFRHNLFLRKSLALLDYFAAILFGYFEPFVTIEWLWIPYLLLEIIALFPTIMNITLIVILGFFGSVGLSSALLTSTVIIIQQVPYSYAQLALFYYIPISILLIIVSIQNHITHTMYDKMLALHTLKEKLEKINRQVTDKMYQLRAASTAEERKRISKEIHDTAGYIFINLIMMLQAAAAVIHKNSEKALRIIQESRDYAEKGINEIRHILKEVREPQQSLSLQNEFYEISDSFNKATGVHLTIEYGNWPKTLPGKFESFFISFLQECLTNSLKHGYATQIQAICWMTKEHILMTVSDNGRGASGVIQQGIGLSSIEEFVTSYHGKHSITTDVIGFEIMVSLPIKELSHTSEVTY